MKFGKKFFATLLAAAVAVTTLVVPTTEAQAAVTSYIKYPTVDENGEASYTKKDQYGIEIPDKVKMSYKNDADIDYGFSIYLPKDASVVSVKSNKKKDLIANIFCNTYSIPYTYNSTYTYTDGTTYTYSHEDVDSEPYAYIGLYAKKAGKFSLTVKIRLADSTVVTKKISVLVVKDWDPYTITYSGTTYDDDEYIKTVAKTGKLKVKAGKGCKITKIEFANTFDADGKPIFKTIKNGKKVKLNTKKVILQSQISDAYDLKEDGKVIGTRSYVYKYATPIKYSYIYPVSVVRISYKDNFLGVTHDVDDADDDNASAAYEYIYQIK